MTSAETASRAAESGGTPVRPCSRPHRAPSHPPPLRVRALQPRGPGSSWSLASPAGFGAVGRGRAPTLVPSVQPPAPGCPPTAAPPWPGGVGGHAGGTHGGAGRPPFLGPGPAGVGRDVPCCIGIYLFSSYYVLARTAEGPDACPRRDNAGCSAGGAWTPSFRVPSPSVRGGASQALDSSPAGSTPPSPVIFFWVTEQLLLK
nr:putative uncharacterized protein WWC2-AS2 [Pan paniscus]